MTNWHIFYQNEGNIAIYDLKGIDVSTQDRFEALFENRLSNEDAREFLVSLYKKGESAQEIAVAAKVMRSYSVKLPLDDELREKAIDIVGTGGDKSGSFNISTTVSLLLSSLGCVVAKHGNRSITSKSGSADLLEELGVRIDLSVESQMRMLKEVGFAFIYAINHHPAMKHIMPIRRSIEHRSIFNILGPLTNPSGAKKYLLGVFDPSFISKMADALVLLDAKRAFVVSSLDGMDEISISAVTKFAYVESGKISFGEIDPQVHGFKLAPKEEILGADAIENALITRSIFDNELKGAKRDIVVLNAAYALFADSSARDIKEGVEMATYALESNKAKEHMQKIIKLSNALL